MILRLNKSEKDPLLLVSRRESKAKGLQLYSPKLVLVLCWLWVATYGHWSIQAGGRFGPLRVWPASAGQVDAAWIYNS
jgi:hypothetical protein